MLRTQVISNDVDLGHVIKTVSARLLCCKVTIFPFCTQAILRICWKPVAKSPHTQRVWNRWWWVSCRYYLTFFSTEDVSPPPSVFIYSVISKSRCGLIYTYLHFGLSSRAALFILLFKSFQLCCFRCVPLTCPLLSCHFPCLCHYKMHFPCSTISREHWLLLQESGVEKPRLAGG